MSLILLACVGTTDAPKDATPQDTSRDSGADSGETGRPDSGPDDTETAAHTGDDTAPAPVDRDGDGYGAAEEGGDDCDDARPDTHPGATEWCDLIDHDCDGAPLAEGVCAGIQDGRQMLLSVYTWDDPEYGAGAGPLQPDLTGDGIPDWYTSCDRCNPDGIAGILMAGRLDNEPSRVPEDAVHQWNTGHYTQSEIVRDVGDVNGDGAFDLAMVGHDEGRGVLVFYGPFALDGRNDDAWSVADVIYESEPDGDGSGWALGPASGFDLDHDGRDDFVATPATDDAEPVKFDVFLGGSRPGEYVRILGEDTEYPDHPYAHGDVDGDGVMDIFIANDDGYPAWISGADISGSDGATSSDIFAGWWEPDAAEPRAWMDGADGMRVPGDMDGDGYADVLQGALVDDYSRGGYVVYQGPVTGPIPITRTVGWLYRSDFSGVDHLEIADFDGDGARDLIVDCRDLDGDYAHVDTVWPGSYGMPAPGTDLSEGFLSWNVDKPIYYTGDVDLDGYDDLISTFTSANDTANVLRGWPVPSGQEPWF